MSNFVIDQDVFIPTGVPATPEQVADLIADPDIPLTEDHIPLIAEDQRPSREQLDNARLRPRPTPTEEP